MSAVYIICSHGGVRQCLCGAWFLTGSLFIPWIIDEQIWSIGGISVQAKCVPVLLCSSKFHVDYPETEPSPQMRNH
jgi:hypothetical protein